MLKSPSVPVTPRGKSALATLPPWHCSSDGIAVEHWTDPETSIAAHGTPMATARIQLEEKTEDPPTVFNSPTALRRYFPRLTAGQAVPILEPVVSVIIRLLADADRALTSDRAAAKSYIAQATTLLRADYARLVAAERHPPVLSIRNGLSPCQIATVERYIEQKLHSAIQISTLAAVCRLSASYFTVAFKRSRGESPRVYLTRKRVARAQELMLATNQPLAHIAQDCGFCDQAHFSRIFRQSTGLTPNTWRRRWSLAPRNAAAAPQQGDKDGEAPRADWRPTKLR
jgi:AraC-like DNA-binding protein